MGSELPVVKDLISSFAAVAEMWPLGVSLRPLLESSVDCGHQVARINRLWSHEWRCVAKAALLYAHFWPVQGHTGTDQQLSAATRRCNCFSTVSLSTAL